MREIECRWCGGAVDGGCNCEASQEIARLTRERDEARAHAEEASKRADALRSRVEALEGAAERLRACMLHADWSNEVINDFLSMFDAEMEAALRGEEE